MTRLLCIGTVVLAALIGAACQQREPEAATPKEAPQPTPKPEVIEVEREPVEPPPPPPTASELLPGARVLDEKIMDAPLKTQIELRVAIPGDTTKSQLTRYMHQLYAEQMARTGFEARPTPNAVYAFLYTEDVDWTTNGSGWVGRIAKAAADERPTFDNHLVSGSLLEQCRRTVTNAEFELRGPTILIDYPLAGYGMSDKPTPREISDSMMGNLFLAAAVLYNKIPVDSTESIFTYQGKTVGRIALTRATYYALDERAEMQKAENVMHAAWDAVSKGKLSGDQAQAREDRAFAAAYRRMLKKHSYCHSR